MIAGQDVIKNYNNQTLTVESGDKIVIPSSLDTYTNFALFVLLMVVFILFTRKIIEGVARSYTSAFSRIKLREIDWELVLRSNRNYALLFSLFLFGFILSYHIKILDYLPTHNEVPQIVIFSIICLSIVIYILLKRAALSVLDYVNETVCFKEINRFYRNYLIISLTLILLGEMCFYLFPLKYTFLTVWFTISCIAPYILYLIMATRVIFENKFSLFFYILYICALELLPLVLVIKLILKI